MSKVTKSENFTNFLDHYLRTHQPDLLVEVYNELTKETYFELSLHREILLSASDYFRVALKPVFLQQDLQQPLVRLKVSLHLEEGALSESVVRLFFQLFYVPRFDTIHLAAASSSAVAESLDGAQRSLTELIQENVLYLYQLAHCFRYTTLANHCEGLLFESMTVEYFFHLTKFCLTKNDQTGRFSIIEERRSIYSRLLQWYQCCIEHSPYTKLFYTPSVAKKYGRRYLSCQKEEILRDIFEHVDKSESCGVPTKNHRYCPETGVTQIDYFRRICVGCLTDSQTEAAYGGFYYINFGAIKKHYANGYEQYFFRLKRNVRNHTLLSENILEMAVVRVRYPVTSPRKKQRRLYEMLIETPQNASDEEMETDYTSGTTSEDDEVEIEVEGEREEEEGEEDEIISGTKQDLEKMPETEETLYRCKTRISLLSKKVQKDEIDCKYNQKNFQAHSEVSFFDVHDAKHCYEGKCDTCQSKRPIYIIQMTISLESSKEYLEKKRKTLTTSIDSQSTKRIRLEESPTLL